MRLHQFELEKWFNVLLFEIKTSFLLLLLLFSFFGTVR